MFQRLVSHNPDLERLVEEGYAVSFDNGYIVVRDIPYLDAGGALQIGAIVAKLVQVDANRVKQSDHQIYFAGSHPYGLDGVAIANLGGGSVTFQIGENSTDVAVQRSFSNKPAAGAFVDFYEKIRSYTNIISGPAIEKFDASPYTYRTANTPTESVFRFQDTLTSRAEIVELSVKLKDDVVAIIGAGGTGAYVLDFMAKTPVREIRVFDGDLFHVHNAFRSPGKLDDGELDRPKAEIYAARYEPFRHGVSGVAKRIDHSCAEDLEGVTFAFVCVDSGEARTEVFDLLIERAIPFIDVGMGLNRKQGPLTGMLRTTYYPVDRAAAMRDLGLAETADVEDDIYHANIQISELNALNACFAVIRYKQVRGFYLDESSYLHMLFGLADTGVAREADFG